MGYVEDKNNRSLRFEKLIDQYDQISYQDFLTIKYDQEYANPIFCPFKINKIFSVEFEESPEVQDVLQLIQQWDRKAGINSIGAAQFSIFYKTLRKKLRKMKFDYELEIPDSTLLQTLRETKTYLTKHFEQLEQDFHDICDAILTAYYDKKEIHTVTGRNGLLQIRTKDSKYKGKYHPIIWKGQQLSDKGFAFYLTGKFGRELL